MKKNVKSVLSALCAASMVMAAPVAVSAEGVSGTFSGIGQGIGGDVTVTLTLTDGVITDVQVDGPNETDGIGSVAIEKMPGEIVASNSLSVDGVSGATVTSTAIIDGATAALAEAGLKPEDLAAVAGDETEAAAEAAEDVVTDTDVVVIGAGGAGMVAAINIKEAGKDVIVLESQPMTGGNTVRSTGGMNAAKTTYQDANEFAEQAGVEKTLATATDDEALKAALDENVSDENIAFIKDLAATVQKQYDEYNANPEGYFDSVELMELDTMIGGHGINNPELVKTLAENSADTIDWLDTTVDAQLQSVGAFGGASVKRIHRPVNDEGKTTAVGAYIVPKLTEKVESEGIEVLYNTTATKILMEDGKAVGVEAEGESGNTVTVNAKAVVIATGGFGANLDKVVEYRPDLAGFCTTNAAGAQGQGIEMATEVGAATVDLDQIQIHPTVHLDDQGNAHLITEGLRGDGAILVNQNGERFYDEVSTRDKVSAAEIEQQNATGADHVWLIIDQAMADASAVIQGYINNGYTVTGQTYEELAAAMGIEDPAVFADTMDKWNACVEAGEDTMLSENQRTSFANPLNTAPYYAITVTPGIHHTMGGVVIDSSAEVLDENGAAIPGLFAAGEVTGGVHGANRLGGNAVADICVFGRIAGNSAVAYVDAQ